MEHQMLSIGLCLRYLKDLTARSTSSNIEIQLVQVEEDLCHTGPHLATTTFRMVARCNLLTTLVVNNITLHECLDQGVTV